MAEELEYLDDCKEKLPVEDLIKVMGGSVNHRYYGVEKVLIDEDRFTITAAAGKAALKEYVPGSALLRSYALNRVADKNEITGAVIHIAMKAYAKREEVGTQIFAIEEKPKEEEEKKN